MSGDGCLSETGDAFDGGGEVVVRSVFGSADSWHTAMEGEIF